MGRCLRIARALTLIVIAGFTALRVYEAPWGRIFVAVHSPHTTNDTTVGSHPQPVSSERAATSDARGREDAGEQVATRSAIEEAEKDLQSVLDHTTLQKVTSSTQIFRDLDPPRVLEDKAEEPALDSNSSLAARLLHIYGLLCSWGARSQGDVRKLSNERRELLMLLYAPLVEAAPPGTEGLRPESRPGGVLSATSASCTEAAVRLGTLLTGRRRPEGPRVVVDLFTGMGGGAELDLLELRLHELDGVADVVVVTESPFGNRCDRKLLHFDRHKGRFEEFLPRIVHVVTDRCEGYMKSAMKCNKKKHSKRPAGIYFQEHEQRLCAMAELQRLRPNLPEDALVLVTDLDEIPNGRVINALKHCELRPDARLPLRLQLRAIPYSLRTGCPSSRPRYNKGNVALWRQVKTGKVHIWPLQHTDPVERGGVHLSSYGGRHSLDYRLLNHGESGQILPMVLPGGKSISNCDANSVAKLRLMQQQLNEFPNAVARRFEKRGPGARPLERARASELQSCDLPWPLLTHPERYPFLWGDGTFS